MTIERKLLGTVDATATEAVYIEDVMATYLYTGTGASQTITNGIDLSTNGGMVWIKSRSNALNHQLFDSARGKTSSYYYRLCTVDTGQQFDSSGGITSFNTDGYSLGGSGGDWNTSSYTYASWTFRKQAKFFDVQTKSHTNGSASTVDLSALGTVGMVIVKRTDSTSDWYVWHRSLTASNNIRLNTTAAQTAASAYLSVSGTTLTLSSSTPTGTYVVYSYAHDAGGFGAAGTDSIVACGSYTGNGSNSGPVVNLGWEPQFLLIRNISITNSWVIIDNMRLIAVGGDDSSLYANLSNAEVTASYMAVNSTGFQPESPSSDINGNGNTLIYLAIRRGPMKTPTDATKVFKPFTYTGTNTNNYEVTGVGFSPDTSIYIDRDKNGYFRNIVTTRLTGSKYLATNYTDAEAEGSADYIQSFVQDGIKFGTTAGAATNSSTYFGGLFYTFRRAPGFFDVVCYTGTGSATTVAHNLGVAPELMIVKKRGAASTTGWLVYHSGIGNNNKLYLNLTNSSAADSTAWNSTTPTSAVFSVGTNTDCNASAATFVAYLFATCSGVSKVGSYTGSGATKQIDCGFASGARFVLIKRTDSTGDWYVWDTARGLVSGNDPYLLLNATSAEVTNTDYIDPYSAGFEISSTAPAAINASGGTFIYLAIA